MVWVGDVSWWFGLVVWMVVRVGGVNRWCESVVWVGGRSPV